MKLSLLIITCFASARGRLLHAVCNGNMTIYADGKVLLNNGQGRANTTNLPVGTKVVGISCQSNDGKPPWIAASMDNGFNPIYTDKSWFCSNTSVKGWNMPEFNDRDSFFKPPKVCGETFGRCTRSNYPPVSRNAKYIWEADSTDTAYCRMTFDLLFLDDSTIFKLPSFVKGGCELGKFPDKSANDSSGRPYRARGLPAGFDTLGACGVSGQCWELDGERWRNTSKLMQSRRGAGFSDSTKGWLITGGQYWSNTLVISSTELFRNGKWDPWETLPEGLYGHCQVQVDKKVFVIGGTEYCRRRCRCSSKNAFSMDFSKEDVNVKWELLQSMDEARSAASCVYKDGLIYVFGGSRLACGGRPPRQVVENLKSIETYNVTSGEWSKFNTFLPNAIFDSTAILYENHIYLIGGFGSRGSIYKLTGTNQWEEVSKDGPNRTPGFLPGQKFQCRTCECGIARNNTFPWIARIHFPGLGKTCSGVIINSRWILTALQCVLSDTSTPFSELPTELNIEANVTIGYRINKRNKLVKSRRARQLSSRGIWINKEGADLALVNIYDDDNDNGDIDIYSYPPICMPSQGEVLNSSNSGAFVGINNKISMDKDLFEMNDTCWPNAPYKDFFLCAGNETDTFSVESAGGPVMVKQDDRWTLAGLLSGGYKTKLKGPGIAVSMYRWRDWVNNIVAGREGKDC